MTNPANLVRYIVLCLFMGKIAFGSLQPHEVATIPLFSQLIEHLDKKQSSDEREGKEKKGRQNSVSSTQEEEQYSDGKEHHENLASSTHEHEDYGEMEENPDTLVG